MGKRPDRTDAIGRAIRRHLNDDERVLAAVDVQRPGTMEAAQSAGVDGALVGAVDAPFSVTDLPDPMSGPWGRQTAELGIEDRVGKRAIWLHLVVTTSRVLLVRRSRLTRRPREVVAAWPIGDVDRIEVPRGGSGLTIHRGGVALTLELPQAHRFLPQVYRDLPEILARAQEA